MKRRSKKVYYKWFLSYLLILLPPIMIGFVIYTQTLKANREQAEQLNQSLMQIVKNELDNQVSGVNKCLDRVALDANVQTLSNVRGKLSPKDQYYMYMLYSNVKNVNFSEQYCEDVFVFFKNLDWVVSTRGNMSFEMYDSLYSRSDEYGLEEMKQYLSKFHFRKILPTTKVDNNYLLFTMTNLKSGMGEPSATVGVRLNVKTLDQLFESAKWDDRIQMVILNSENQSVSDTRKNRLLEGIRYEDLVEGENFNSLLEGEPYIGSVMDSDQIDWKYVILSPQSLVEKNARQIQRICLIGLCASILIGLFLSYYLSKLNYSPVKGLLDVFKKQGNLSMEDENEFQWLNKQSQHFFSEFHYNKRLLSDNAKKLKEYNLLKLLDYSYYAQEMQGDFWKYRIRLDSLYNIVIIFVVDSRNQKERFTDSYTRENALHKFITNNIFEEMVLEYYLIEMVEIGEKIAAVINLPDQISAVVKIKELVEEAQQAIEENFNFNVTALMGSAQLGVEGIHISYTQAREVGEYAEILDTDFIIYDDVKNVQKKYDYTMDMEQKIINAIKVGDSKSAYENIRQVFNQNFSDQISIHVCRCLIFDMMGTLLKGAEEGGYDAFRENSDFSRELSAKMPIEELKQKFKAMTEEICDGILQMQKNTDEDKKLSRTIETYIQENYMDPDLNISMLGQQFHMTPAYLSAIYKKQTGGSLLDFINRVRIDQAEILLTKDQSVVETAQMVGFRDSGAFIRVFKKRKGVTPGQLKRGINT